MKTNVIRFMAVMLLLGASALTTAAPMKKLARRQGPHSPGTATPSMSAEDLNAFGVFAMKAGQSAEAITSFERAVAMNGASAQIWGKLAYLYLKEGRTLHAVEAFKKGKELGDANCDLVSRNGVGGPFFP